MSTSKTSHVTVDGMIYCDLFCGSDCFEIFMICLNAQFMTQVEPRFKTRTVQVQVALQQVFQGFLHKFVL
jgi:hypothetical protein